MLVETVCERKSLIALKTKMEAVVIAKISNANHAYLPYVLEVRTYFHPCKEVSWKKVAPKRSSFSVNDWMEKLVDKKIISNALTFGGRRLHGSDCSVSLGVPFSFSGNHSGLIWGTAAWMKVVVMWTYNVWASAIASLVMADQVQAVGIFRWGHLH